MLSTPLHHKPIVYGSAIADMVFFAFVVIHVLPSIVAPVAAVVAFAAKKGGRLHIRAGKTFVWSMAAVAVTGIAIVLVRLFVYYDENHTKYAGHSMPSTIPARLGFLFAGLCVLYLLRVATPPRGFSKMPAGGNLVVPGLLLALGVGLSLLVILRFNPWSGALWMIWTFSALVVLGARASGVARHRFGMSFLAAFSWWGALQGFGPAIGHAIKGVDQSTTPYVGDRPGPFTPFFFLFLVGWGLPFLLGAYFVRRFRLQRASARS